MKPEPQQPDPSDKPSVVDHNPPRESTAPTISLSERLARAQDRVNEYADNREARRIGTPWG